MGNLKLLLPKQAKYKDLLMAFQAHQRSFVMEEGFHILRRISSSGGLLIAIQRHSNIRSDNDTLSEGIKIHGLEQVLLLASAHFVCLGYTVILE